MSEEQTGSYTYNPHYLASPPHGWLTEQTLAIMTAQTQTMRHKSVNVRPETFWDYRQLGAMLLPIFQQFKANPSGRSRDG